MDNKFLFNSHVIDTYKTNVTDLSNYPSDDNISPKQLKEIFDGRTDKEVKNSINGIIGALLAPSAAEQIGADGGTVQEALDSKVSKEEGKGLSSEDYTSGEKNKLSGIADGAQVNTVNSVAGKTGDVELSKSDVGLSNVDNTSDEHKPVSNAVSEALRNKANKDNPNFEGTLNLGDVEIYVDSDGNLVFHNPSRFDENGFPINPDGILSLSDYLLINGDEVFHRGNLKNLAESNNALDEFERDAFMANTGLDVVVGDIETALDEIIAMQNKLIGGDA